MAFKRLSFGKSWTSSADFPTFQDSEEQVRADMQYHPNAVRDFLNNVLLKELEQKTAAANLGATTAEGAAATVQSVLNGYAQDIATLTDDIETLAGGGVPVTAQCVAVVFTTESWVNISDGVLLTIAKSEHKRNDANFGYNLYQQVGSEYRGGTWSAAATRATYNADGSITLTADAAYNGKIVFFGL